MIVLAFGINDPVPPFSDIEAILNYGAMVFGQWALIAIPMWLVASFIGLRFVLDATASANEGILNRQIGIREAMILTAVVAAVLGAASLRSGALREVSINWGIAAELGFITAASGIMAFVPLLGMLISRKWLLSIGGTLLLVTGAIGTLLFVVWLAWPGPGGYRIIFWRSVSWR
jgi:hypothetical protein